MHSLFPALLIVKSVLLTEIFLTSNISLVSSSPSQALKNAIIKEITLSDVVHESFSFVEVDLNGDGKKETIAILYNGSDCSNRHCPGFIFKNNSNHTNYKLISKFSVSRGGGNVFISRKGSHGYKNIIASTFFYAPKRTEYRAWKFDGANYNFIDKEITSPSEKAIFTADSPSFKLR
jgi:hypothetical protein